MVGKLTPSSKPGISEVKKNTMKPNCGEGTAHFKPTTVRVKQWFLCLVALCHLSAFASLYVQWEGLYGVAGIMPAHQAKPREFSLLTISDYLNLPLQTTADLVCLAAVVVSSILLAFPSCRISLAYLILGVLYFSLYQVGRTFLWFQWDILLLETTVLSVLVAPLLPLRSTLTCCHDNISLWLVRWLAFRLMFASGVVKLTSGCPTWWGLTALNWHYESQCIPTPLAWYTHQLPEFLQKLSVVKTFIIEILYPFLFFYPQGAVRALGVYAQVFLMVMIMLTGNYNFFNILTCALVITSLDDSFLPRASTLVGYLSPTSVTSGGMSAIAAVVKLPVKLLIAALKLPYNVATGAVGSKVSTVSVSLVLLLTLYIMRTLFNVSIISQTAEVVFDRSEFYFFLEHAVPMAIIIGVLSLSFNIIKSYLDVFMSSRSIGFKAGEVVQITIVSLISVSLFSMSLINITELDQDTQNQLPLSVQNLYHKYRPYHVTNSYGLFRRMTGVGGRPEVVFEGSERADSGWKEYDFKYKPGKLNVRPPVVIPHQPRLDWQMWFAALGSYDYNPWIINLAYQLLQNNTHVIKLLHHNPFPDTPPKFIRALKYRYHYTKIKEGGLEWWDRDSQEEYFPPLALYQPTLKQFLDYHGYTAPLHEDHKDTYLDPYLQVVRRVVEKADPVILIWTVILLPFLPHFKALRVRFSLFGI